MAAAEQAITSTATNSCFNVNCFMPRYNVNVHGAAAKNIVSKIRAARGSVCNVLLSDDSVRLSDAEDEVSLKLSGRIARPSKDRNYSLILSLNQCLVGQERSVINLQSSTKKA